MGKSSDIVGTVYLVSVAVQRVIRVWIAVARWPLLSKWDTGILYNLPPLQLKSVMETLIISKEGECDLKTTSQLNVSRYKTLNSVCKVLP